MSNPFFFAGKITNTEYFVGREKEIKKIFGYLDTTHSDQIQHVSVVGQRRIGKSSLLYHLSQIYSTQLSEHKNYHFVYLDLDNPHCHTQFGLLRHILEKLNLPAPAQPTLERFYDLIEQEHDKKKTWPVFLMDEFEHLPERATEFPDQFYDSLRSLGNNNIVGLITASQSKLQDLASQGKLTSPFFNIFHQIDLKEFNDIEANTLLKRGRSSDQPFTNSDCEQILKIAGKYPARLQVVANLVYETKANNQPLDWKIIKAEAHKEPPFNIGTPNIINRTNWLMKIFWDIPRYIGHISSSRKGLNMVNLVPTKETRNHVQTYKQDYPNNPFRASPKRL
ncbi:MAG: ATP-binding protein, partial [Anaerolineales bacterium]